MEIDVGYSEYPDIYDRVAKGDILAAERSVWIARANVKENAPSSSASPRRSPNGWDAQHGDQLMSWTRIVVGLGVSTGIFYAAKMMASLSKTQASIDAVWFPQFFMKIAIIVLSVLAIVALGRSRFRDFGFKAPERPRWLVVLSSGALLGACASAGIILSGGKGNPVIKGFSFLQLVLLVWLLSSISEEILTRGFLQSYLMARGFDGRSSRLDASAIISGVFFGAMHLTLLGATDIVTVAIIVSATTLLGLLAGFFRSRTGSLLPAIATHVAFNIGGVVGGIVVILTRALLN